MRRLLAAALLLSACSSTPQEAPSLAGQPMKPSALNGFEGSIEDSGPRVLIAGQPTPEGLANARDSNVKVVINLRPDSEQSYDERSVAVGLGMQYVSIPITLNSLDDKSVAAFIEAVRAVRKRPDATDRVLVHCHTGNRAAALWAMYEIADGKVKPEDAVARARMAGMKSPELVQFIGEWARRTGAW